MYCFVYKVYLQIVYLLVICLHIISLHMVNLRFVYITCLHVVNLHNWFINSLFTHCLCTFYLHILFKWFVYRCIIVIVFMTNYGLSMQSLFACFVCARTRVCMRDSVCACVCAYACMRESATVYAAMTLLCLSFGQLMSESVMRITNNPSLIPLPFHQHTK